MCFIAGVVKSEMKGVDSPPPTFACPSCHFGVPLDARRCAECGAEWSGLRRDGSPFLDFVLQNSDETDSSPRWWDSLILPRGPVKQEVFRSPIISFLYERGWRDSFRSAGFPGIDAEYKLAREYFRQVSPNASFMDLSCGSGLMVRRFARDRVFKRTVAVDFSESMLHEVDRRQREDSRIPNFELVRADVAHLPFARATFDAIHSGAALHCWPRVQDGLAEVFRVLKPGGLFFATTFIRPIPSLPMIQGNQPYRFFSRDELTWLSKSAGFDTDVEVQFRCAILRLRKPK